MVREDRAGAASSFAGLTAREATTAVARMLGEAGIEEPGRDARLLVQGALRLSAEEILKAPELRLDDKAGAELAAFARRRAAYEPVSRILGRRGFFGRTFRITPATLDPRPCTETVIEAALAVVDLEGWRERPLRILDVGTGSGALLVTLLAELEQAGGLGTDISEAALEAARDNAAQLGVASRARFINRRSLSGIEGPFDLVVSNPPYIPSADIAGLAPEVRDYDPRAALDGGPDGLNIYRELAEGLLSVVPDGWMLVEVGAGQAEAVENLLSRAAGSALRETRQWADLGHHTRCVAVRTQRYPSH